MARRKPTLPEDRLVGIRAHKKRDLFEGCNEPGKPWFTPNAQEFQKAFCRICRNEECIRAQGATTPWHHRMETQVEHLLNHPVFSDLSTEAHKTLAAQAFDDITAKATRLEIARQRQDWEIPEGPTDGIDRVAARKATEDVDAAIKALAEAKGHTAPDLPKSEGEDQPSHFSEADPGGPDVPQPGDPAGVEYETMFPSSDGKTNYRIVLTTDGLWSCECKGFKHVQHCKHLDEVKPWYEEHKHDDELEQEAETPADPEPAPQVPKAAPAPRRVPPPAQPSAAFNTPMPGQGVMVDGGDAPGRAPSQLPPVQDPWAPRKDTIIQPGATVVMKSKKK